MLKTSEFGIAAEFQLVANPVKKVMLSTQGQLMTETLSTNSRDPKFTGDLSTNGRDLQYNDREL